MSKKEKRGLLLLVVIAILIIVVIFLVVKNKDNGKGQETPAPVDNTPKEEFVQVLDNGTKLNTSKTFSKAKKVDGLEVSNIQLTYANGISTVLADVKNTTTSPSVACDLAITFYDKQGNVILTMPGYVDAIPAGGTVQLNTNVTADFANAYDFSVEKK